LDFFLFYFHKIKLKKIGNPLVTGGRYLFEDSKHTYNMTNVRGLTITSPGIETGLCYNPRPVQLACPLAQIFRPQYVQLEGK
jgi:hypothetical protein